MDYTTAHAHIHAGGPAAGASSTSLSVALSCVCRADGVGLLAAFHHPKPEEDSCSDEIGIATLSLSCWLPKAGLHLVVRRLLQCCRPTCPAPRPALSSID